MILIGSILEQPLLLAVYIHVLELELDPLELSMEVVKTVDPDHPNIARDQKALPEEPFNHWKS